MGSKLDEPPASLIKSLGKPVPEMFGLGELKVNAPIGAALLIGVGILFLLDNLGVPVINQISKFWPVLLIVAGVLLLQRRLGGGPTPQAPANQVVPEKPPEGPSNIPGPNVL